MYTYVYICNLLKSLPTSVQKTPGIEEQIKQNKCAISQIRNVENFTEQIIVSLTHSLKKERRNYINKKKFVNYITCLPNWDTSENKRKFY